MRSWRWDPLDRVNTIVKSDIRSLSLSLFFSRMRVQLKEVSLQEANQPTPFITWCVCTHPLPHSPMLQLMVYLSNLCQIIVLGWRELGDQEILRNVNQEKRGTVAGDWLVSVWIGLKLCTYFCFLFNISVTVRDRNLCGRFCFVNYMHLNLINKPGCRIIPYT